MLKEPLKPPHFKVGDRVKVTFPSMYRDKAGLVMEVIEHRGDYVWRYRVRLADGDTAMFFEFELEMFLNQTGH